MKQASATANQVKIYNFEIFFTNTLQKNIYHCRSWALLILPLMLHRSLRDDIITAIFLSFLTFFSCLCLTLLTPLKPFGCVAQKTKNY